MGMHKKYGTNGALTFFSIGTDSSQKLQNANAITRKDWGPVLFLFAGQHGNERCIFCSISTANLSRHETSRPGHHFFLVPFLVDLLWT